MLKQAEELFAKIKAASGYDYDKIYKAYEYANKLHEGQKRISGDDYIVHPISVAEEVFELQLDTDSICAALLHDAVEDCSDKTSLKEIEKKFGQSKAIQKKGASQKAANQTVSKNAVKQGSSYDANTLASRLCHVFPELRPLYQDNLTQYGEFLGEEFFTKYGTKVIIDTIKENNPQTMKKMFQVLNEIYEDGTNDTQSLIAVTILGELNNDQILLARCVDYMSETMTPPVIEVNRYLASAMGKKAKAKLLNPPVYKPKKQKKPGFFAQAMAQGGGAPMPPM